MDAITRKLSLKILKSFKKRDAEFEAERDEWYRSGDGRRRKMWQGPEDDRPYNYGGQGHSFPIACVHGSSAWTDYDNICGPCENGDSVYQLAIWGAQERVAEFRRRLDWLFAAPMSFQRDHEETRSKLINWAFEPVLFED